MTINSEIERLFKTNYEAMLRLALATVHDSDAANDIVHGVFASLLTTGLTAAVDRVYLLRATSIVSIYIVACLSAIYVQCCGG